MPLALTHAPSPPQCGGDVWTIEDPEALAEVSAQILIGRALHAAQILDGVQQPGTPPIIKATLKEKLRLELQPKTEQGIWHRDGLLFEIICWIAARISSTDDEAISDPHLKATTQGTDCVKVAIDSETRVLSCATIYEYKCTIHWRARFVGEVLTAFREYVSGERDNQLAQTAINLLSGLGLSAAERGAAYDQLIRQRPLAFHASMTVQPSGFTSAQRTALFKGFDAIADDITLRGGHTLPLDDIRGWFAAFADQVWSKIDTFDV